MLRITDGRSSWKLRCLVTESSVRTSVKFTLDWIIVSHDRSNVLAAILVLNLLAKLFYTCWDAVKVLRPNETVDDITKKIAATLKHALGRVKAKIENEKAQKQQETTRPTDADEINEVEEGKKHKRIQTRREMKRRDHRSAPTTTTNNRGHLHIS